MIRAFDKDIINTSMLICICMKLGILESEVREVYNNTAKINNKSTLPEDFKIWRDEK